MKQVALAYKDMIQDAGIVILEEPFEQLYAKKDELGGPMTFNHYPIGWAHAMDTPFQWTKQVASHFGGTRNGMAMSWPNGIDAKGEVRQQFHHVIDIMPTILEAVGLPAPASINGPATPPWSMAMSPVKKLFG